MKTNDQIYSLLEKLFDAKLDPMRDDLSLIKHSIYGNGRVGLLERMEVVENEQKNIIARFAVLGTLGVIALTTAFEVIKDFVQKRLGL